MRPPIPLKTLFGDPEKAAPRVSPDGRRLAYMAPDEGVLNVWVTDSLSPGAQARVVTRERRRAVDSYFWACDGRSLIYAQDKDGDEKYHLYQVDVTAEKPEPRDLTPFPGAQALPLATDPKHPHQVLAFINARDEKVRDVHRIDLRTGKAELDTQNPGDVVGWHADAELRVRACVAYLPDGGTELRVRDDEGSPWRALIAWPFGEQGNVHGFTPDGGGLYIESSLDSDTTRLLEIDCRSGRLKELFHSPEADLGSVLVHPTTYAVQAAGFEVERFRWEILDPGLKEDFERLGEVSPGDFGIGSRDDADRWWTVSYNLDDRPPRYYLYDRENKTACFLFSTKPALEEENLASMEPVTISSRDGLKLRCYLTLPVFGPRRDLPLVLLPHGGPWMRDSWGFDGMVLWMADRGYAVLQVNYRGSTGFGKSFHHAGDREWGRKMQDDLTDGVRWAIAQGIADPKRIGVFGGSYGGYAALAGAAFTPDLFACAVDMFGPANLITLIQSIPPYWEVFRRIFDLQVGNVDEEQDFLKSRSPLFSADRIKIPMLIAQGANDPKVKQAESEQIVAALKRNQKDVEYMVFPDEGHGFVRPENRLQFYARAEDFLARHLGGRSEKPA
ncbi:S9 family peptidase [Elusimicrobiota bacterium]